MSLLLRLERSVGQLTVIISTFLQSYLVVSNLKNNINSHFYIVQRNYIEIKVIAFGQALVIVLSLPDSLFLFFSSRVKLFIIEKLFY